MKFLRLGPPFTLFVAIACVMGTYLPGATHFGISGGIASLLLPWTWVRLITWPFVHADTGHLLSNMMFFLLLSPALEKRQGWPEYLLCLLVTSVVIGIGHLVFGSSGSVLIGASGWVFMMIILSTFTADSAGTLSLPTLVVAVLYAWREIAAAMTPNHVSQFAHLLGGACGLLFGIFGSAGSSSSGTAKSGSAIEPSLAAKE